MNYNDKAAKHNLQGLDVDIEISLKEHGFAWIEQDTHYEFYYGVVNNDGEYKTFEHATVDKYTDLGVEYDWADWDGVRNYAGIDDDSPYQELPHVIKALMDYHGRESVFGTHYGDGMSFDDIFENL